MIHEVKKSNRIDKAHIYQLKYYIRTVMNMGVENISGQIDYPKLKKTETVEWKDEDEMGFEAIFSGIKEILAMPAPPPVINKPFCKKCAYYEFCYV